MITMNDRTQSQQKKIIFYLKKIDRLKINTSCSPKLHINKSRSRDTCSKQMIQNIKTGSLTEDIVTKK